MMANSLLADGSAHVTAAMHSSLGPAPPAAALRRDRPLRVGILGGGPAGAFCAIWLCRFARTCRLPIEVTVFDYKSFERPGPAGCNMCAGIIPDSLVRNLRLLDIELPEHVIQRRMEGYLLHTRGGAVDIPTPPGTTIYATFRGPGPLGMYPAAREGFDWWLLLEARKAGARQVSNLVTDVRRPDQPDRPFTVICRDGSAYEQDLVVGAFGVNSNLVAVFQRLGFGYRPPLTTRARQAEIPLDPDFIQDRLRNRVLIFALGKPRLRFAAITPKRQHVTVTLIGDNPSRALLEEVLQSPEVRAHFPPRWELPESYCSCAPKLPVSAARNPVADRLIMIGDTNISRYLKNGIESSFYTGMWAAKAICAGLTTREQLRTSYLSACHHMYLRDNRIGQAVFWLHDLISRSPAITRSHILIARQEQASGRPLKPLSEVLWGLFTGNVPYRTILRKALGLRLQMRLLRALALTAMGSGLGAARAQPRKHTTPAPGSLGPLQAGQRVIIIGGGPAGTSCAITLARAGRARGVAPRVVLIEAKRFGEHQNQDAGVLSPPGPALVHELLGRAPPPGLFQRRIRGYVLHGKERQIRFDGDELGERSFALRRVELDSLLLEEARANGVEVLPARATGVEVDRGRVVVYTEGDSVEGEAAVGAFALDEGMAQALARRTRYRPPAWLETLACKIHPAGLEFIPSLLGDCIHVFLPHQRSVEFGALIPKGNHITVVIAGARLGARDMERFLAQPQVRRLLPPASKLSGYYQGAFPLGPARGLCGDRYVMIGDAAGLVRPFKGKGINCALESGKRCAETMLTKGISGGALSLVERGQRHLTRDVWFGRLVRALVILTERLDLLDPFVEEAERSPALRQALFDCISGRTTYREVVLRGEHLGWLPRALWRCLLHKLGLGRRARSFPLIAGSKSAPPTG